MGEGANGYAACISQSKGGQSAPLRGGLTLPPFFLGPLFIIIIFI